MTGLYYVQVWNGRRWARVRGPEGGPWGTVSRAGRIADGRETSARRASSTEGMPHRVVDSSGRVVYDDGAVS